MSPAQEDLTPLSHKLDSWASLLPAEAEAFQQRRTSMVQEIRAISSAFQRDPGAIAALRERFQDLEQSLGVFGELLAARERVRGQVTELRAITPARRDMPRAVQEATDEYLALIEFLVRSIADTRGIRTALLQIKQIEAWIEERKQALPVLATTDALVDQVQDREHKNEIKTALRDWTRAFCEGRADAAWRSAAQQTVQRFDLWRQAEIPPPVEPEEKPRAPEPAVTIPPKEASAAPETAQIHFYRIDQTLADCRDLADALDYEGAEIATFSSRQWQLRNKPDATLSEIQKVEDDIEACRRFLLKRAETEADLRLQQLQQRWRWFQAVYGARQELAELVQGAEDAKPHAAQRLRELFELIQQAEQRIYAVVDGNRPKLAAHVRKVADSCRAEIEELRQQARLTAVDAQLAGLEQKIPENPGTQVPARQSFERLDKCYGLQREVQKLKEETKAKQDDILIHAERLSAAAAEMAAMSDAAEIAAIAARIPKELTPVRPLDDVAGDLARTEKLLDAHRAALLKAKSAELGELRKENLTWIRILADLTPEADALAVKDAPPQELDQLRVALEVEQRHRTRIGELASIAARQLEERKQDARQRLQVHLDTPAFETHPERDSAAQLLGRIDSRPELPGTPPRDEFSRTYKVVLETEGFLDRIESARRSIPERLQKLEERFEILRERNGIIYRPELARHTNLLLMGIQKAIGQEQWEPLNFQLAQADANLSALERDALARIGAETEELVDQLKIAAKRSTDQIYARQIETALQQLEEEGQLEPPSYPLRQRLSRLLGRPVSASRGSLA